jgi:hypothetical protein
VSRPTVFIHTNEKQLLGAKVAAHALRKTSFDPQSFEVRILRLEEWPALYNRDGQLYLREGEKRAWRTEDLQSFTPLRFLPPQLMGFNGRAVVIDPDVFAFADVMELFALDMKGHSILARFIPPHAGREAYWASSVLLLDCSKLLHWEWDRAIEEMFTFKRDYREWMSLKLEPQGAVGPLDDAWNSFDRLDDDTKMLHNTTRLTQPWKTGLLIDFEAKKALRPTGARKWGLLPRDAIAGARRALGLDGGEPRNYQAHPDPRQESLFFCLLRECVSEGEVSVEELQAAIAKQHIRKDALQLLQRS